MSEKNNRYKGVVGTIGFHLLALLALLYFALSTPLPLPGEEGFDEVDEVIVAPEGDE